MRYDSVNILLVCIDRKNTFRIFGTVEVTTSTKLFRKLIGCLQQIVLKCLCKFMYELMCLLIIITHSMLRKIVCKTNISYTQRTAILGAYLCCIDGVSLEVDESIQTTHRDVTEFFQLIKVTKFAYIDSREDTQGNLTFTIDMLKGFGG